MLADLDNKLIGRRIERTYADRAERERREGRSVYVLVVAPMTYSVYTCPTGRSKSLKVVPDKSRRNRFNSR